MADKNKMKKVKVTKLLTVKKKMIFFQTPEKATSTFIFRGNWVNQNLFHVISEKYAVSNETISDHAVMTLEEIAENFGEEIQLLAISLIPAVIQEG